MKKYLIAAGAALVIASCDLPDNGNTKAPETVPAGTLVANATVSMVDYMQSINVNLNNFVLWSQHLTQTTYTDESNFDYNNRDVNGNTFDRMYATVLRDLSEARGIIANDATLSDATRAQQNATIEVLECYAYATLVDIFGDVPYSEAIGDDLTPAYDGAAAIYADLISRLDAAAGTLSGDNGLGSADLIYGGDGDAWAKFAASTMLKLGVRLSEADATAGSAAIAAAYAHGVMSSSADNATLAYTSNPPHTNPLWDDLVQSGRTDFIAANTLGDVMNANSDPRRGAYFKNLDSTGAVTGAPYGLQSDYYSFSQPGSALEVASRPSSLMDWSEVQFLLAHAAQNGESVGGTAQAYYEGGITTSIEDWGGSAADAATYISGSTVAWDATNWRALLGEQKWVALYTRGNEAWATARMYDLTMNVAAGANRVTPNRMGYGIDEYSLNGTNCEAAGANYNGDDDTARIFWDVN